MMPIHFERLAVMNRRDEEASISKGQRVGCYRPKIRRTHKRPVGVEPVAPWTQVTTTPGHAKEFTGSRPTVDQAPRTTKTRSPSQPLGTGNKAGFSLPPFARFQTSITSRARRLLISAKITLRVFPASSTRETLRRAASPGSRSVGSSILVNYNIEICSIYNLI
jgi:hypothetical protein